MNFFKKDVENYLQNEQHGGLYWYGTISKEFQYTDSLVVNNGVVQYAIINPANRIITHVSVKEVLDEIVVVKVAKTVSGVLAQLSVPELVAFKTYLAARRLPGTKMNITSSAADSVLMNVEIFYSTLFDPGVMMTKVLDVLELFKNEFPFNAILYKSEIIDALSNVDGVVGIGIGTMIVYVTTGGSTVLLDTLIELQAGYFNWDAGNVITLTPSV